MKELVGICYGVRVSCHDFSSDRPSVVRLGEVDFDRVDESQAFDYEVAGVQVHEGYALPAKYNDIAIITLKDRVSITILSCSCIYYTVYIYCTCIYIYCTVIPW